MKQVPTILRRLEDAQFPHAVAIRPGRDPRFGSILEADACDVPGDELLAVQKALGDIVWPVAFEPTTVLVGAIDAQESHALRASPPDETVWYVPKTPSRRSAP